MNRNHSEVKPCWPLFRKKCEACGRKFRWERGVKWNRQAELAERAYPRLDGVNESTCYLCSKCTPRPGTTDMSPCGMAFRVDLVRKRIEESRPPIHHNCRCRVVEAKAAMEKAIEKAGRNLGRSAKGTSVRLEEAARNFARAGAAARVRLEDIHIPRRSKKDGAP